MLQRTKDVKLRKAVIGAASADFIGGLCDCAHNILRGNVTLTASQRKVLRRYKHYLRKLTVKKRPLQERRAILQTGSGGFLTALLAPLIGTILPAIVNQFTG
ncbi:MAG: hypothetical protein M3H12_03090 [Chromatiales bacterium]